ncbi:antitoxin family protein [Geminocystis sp. CENA526]|uniref:antitoxin family protein n=1 Tax=Geminocystis sp. CENA526 TaxID=1355871 RepID=UPI003D6DC8B2
MSQQQSLNAIFENGVFRPLTNFNFPEGEKVKITIEAEKMSKKSFPQNGIIAQLTINPLKIPNFQPLTREEIHER